MGRKTKIAEAIPVPHDGPINFFSTTHDDNAPDDLKEAFTVLKVDSLDESPTQRLWSILTTATLNKDQLQALPAYRSTMLHWHDNKKDCDDKDEVLLTGTYRALLELSLSHKTNQPLRRAIQSNLDMIDTVLGIDKLDGARKDVVASLWDDRYWKNALLSLFEALNYAPLKKVIANDEGNLRGALNLLVDKSSSITVILDQSSFYRNTDDNSNLASTADATETAVELITEIATTLKTLLTHLLQQDDFVFYAYLSLLNQLELILWKGIVCSAMHSDGLSKLGVAYGQTLLVQWMAKSSSPSKICSLAKERIHQVLDDAVVPPLNTLCTIQGIAAVLPDDALAQGSPVSLLEDPVASFLLRQCSEATDGPTRLSALRSLQTLLNRCSSIVKGDTNVSDECKKYIDKLTQETLHIVMSAWENPPGRQVSSAIPGLFNSLVDLIETLHPKEDKAASGLESLVGRVLSQPVNRKGRYIALETLLPIVGAKALLDTDGNQLIESLVKGVGDRAHTAGNIAGLLGKILSKRREEMNKEAGFVVDDSMTLSKKQRRKLAQQRGTNNNAVQVMEAKEPQLLPQWVELWAPHFARGLLSESQVRRKQISAFCIPLLETMVGGSSRRMDASVAMSALLKHLELEHERQLVSGSTLPVVSYDAETADDIFVWAKLELARQACAQKLITAASTPQVLLSCFRDAFPEEILRGSLIHRSPRVRLVAFAALEAVLPTFDTVSSRAEAVYLELNMWQAALPYAFKSEGKEYTSTLLQYLTAFLNRLSLTESEEVGDDGTGKVLASFSSFVESFLIDGLIMKQAAYPGTVADKEQFAISLLNCIVSFSMGDGTKSNGFWMTGQTIQRRLQLSEIATLESVVKKLMSTEVLATLLSLCHSTWDSARSAAFRCLCAMIQSAHARDIALPIQLYDESVATRGVFLSSSPRQREADTGAMILAVTACLKSEVSEREEFVRALVKLAEERVDTMKESLRQILQSNLGSAGDVTEKGLALPLAHGLLHSVRLVIEMTTSMSKSRLSRDLIVRLVALCCESIQMCLSVVADVKEGETLEGMDVDVVQEYDTSSNVPLNVNTGAIGANATFSSVKEQATGEALRRFATQRVVMGSWLLTREACATLASAVSYDPMYASCDVVSRAGQLLLTTMTALKHQGAAFAAQKALQTIATHCNSKATSLELRELPSQWSERLLMEISSTEKVRDSTLRRSTGYGLGFLALMRPELTVKVAPKTLCPRVLAELVLLSLPPRSLLIEHTDKLGLTNASSDVTSLFSASLRSRREGLTFVETNEATTRVHALNVLRLIILDAPLASEVAPFIGDSIISAMIGYADESWAVRNSATMVFSAAMLRVVDSDKNASKKGDTDGNAVTAVEFFRQYSPLKAVLLAVLRSDFQSQENASVSQHSPVFFVLLLLARMQPILKSGVEAAVFTDSFVLYVVNYLAHNEHKIRIMAARALANIASNDPTRESHNEKLLVKCAHHISTVGGDWNVKHGALLAILEILHTLPTPSTSCAQSGVSRSISVLCSGASGCAPSCSSLAIEIRSFCLQQGPTQSRADIDDLVTFCLGLVDEQEAELLGNHREVVGAATQSEVAGKVACGLLVELLWKEMIDPSQHLDKLQTLLTSNVIDTRLVASKTLKKSIYGNIDQLLLSSELETTAKLQLLNQVARMLYTSLTSELARSASRTGLGAHPPTVRRISRCLLECLYAATTIGCSELDSEELWSASDLMLGAIVTQDIDPDDKALGNAVEIMAHAIVTRSSDQHIDKKANRFSLIVEKLNDPLAPWRVRHSVALAIETSGLLQLDGRSSALQKQILMLLQDNDPDVRFVAARCMTKHVGSSSVAALFALEQAYSSMGANIEDSSVGQYLLSSLADRFDQTSSRIEQVLAELLQSDTASDGAALLNTDTKRKIFEDEDANPYEEPLLACHLTICTLVKSGATLSSSEAECSRILTSAGLLLEKLQARYVQGEINGRLLHDITRNNALFPDIQGILVSCIALVYLGGTMPSDLVEKAEFLVGACQDSTMHPDILATISGLAVAGKGDAKTRNALFQLCFLVPSQHKMHVD